MVNLKNNNGINVSLYVSNYGNAVVLVQADFKWYDENATCDLNTFLKYKDSIETLFTQEYERLNHSENDSDSPMTKQRILNLITRYALENRFEFDFCKEV